MDVGTMFSFRNSIQKLKLQMIHQHPQRYVASCPEETKTSNLPLGCRVLEHTSIHKFSECPGTDVGLKTLSRCSFSESLSCIQSSLVCDSKIDCGFEDNFGLDENERCYFPYLYAGVALLIILLMLLFLYGFVHWVRMKSKQWHLSSHDSNQNPASSSNEHASRGGDPASMCEAAVESVDAMDASMGAF